MQARDVRMIAAKRGPAPRWMRVVTVTTAAGLVLGVLGPFGSYLDDGMLLRSAYWVGATWLGLVLYGSGIAISNRLTDAGSRGRWALLGLSVLVASIPQAVITRMVALRIWPGLLRYGPGWWLWYVQAATIGAITVLGVTVWRDGRSGRPAPLPAAVPANGGIIPRAGRSASPKDVIALQMEDHYVRVHTLGGSTLVLVPLTQAIRQVASLEGLRTHRSWWVARHAVQRVEGSPRSMRLTLLNGLSAPVARNAVALLREAGWLEDTPVGQAGRDRSRFLFRGDTGKPAPVAVPPGH